IDSPGVYLANSLADVFGRQSAGQQDRHFLRDRASERPIVGLTRATPMRCWRVEEDAPACFMVGSHHAHIVLTMQAQRFDNRTIDGVAKLRRFFSMQLYKLQTHLF